MLVVRGESRLAPDELLRRAMRKKMLLLDAEKVGSLEELELAYALARKSIADGAAIGKSLETEFVLWLAGKRDIKRAFEEVGFAGGKEFIAVAFGMGKKELISGLEMKGRKLGLKKNAGWERIEQISLSRII